MRATGTAGFGGEASVPGGLQVQAGTLTAASLASTLGFASACSYLLSQAYTIPILKIGPSWAVWPMPPDFATALLAASALLLPHRRDQRMRRYRRALALLFGFCSLSFLVLVVCKHLLFGLSLSTGSVTFGGFHIVRLVEFYLVFSACSRIQLNDRRLAILQWLTFAVLGWQLFAVVVTYLGIIPAWDFAPQLPQSKTISGAWEYYVNSKEEGLGTIGYNHAYVAAQLTLLSAMALQFAARGKGRLQGWPAIAILLATLVAVFMTGSRAGLGTHLAFTLGYLVRSPIKMLVGLAASLVVFSAVESWVENYRSMDEMAARHSTLTNPFEDDNLSGRDNIWSDRIEWLNENPLYWVIGGGVGSTADTGGPAHMLPLQIIAELGVIGLAFSAILLAKLLVHQLAARRRLHAFFWVTVALLISSATQETFYPEPALGHFMGLYLFAVAIFMRSTDEPGEVLTLRSRRTEAKPPERKDGLI